MSMVNIDGIDYRVLGSINTGKREYIFVTDGEDIIYYKRVENGYERPSKNLTIEGYAGKSLSELTENVIICNMLTLLRKDYIDN